MTGMNLPQAMLVKALNILYEKKERKREKEEEAKLEIRVNMRYVLTSGSKMFKTSLD